MSGILNIHYSKLDPWELRSLSCTSMFLYNIIPVHISYRYCKLNLIKRDTTRLNTASVWRSPKQQVTHHTLYFKSKSSCGIRSLFYLLLTVDSLVRLSFSLSFVGSRCWRSCIGWVFCFNNFVFFFWVFGFGHYNTLSWWSLSDPLSTASSQHKLSKCLTKR